MADEVHPALKETVVDRAQTSLRALTSLIDAGAPGVGSIFGELIAVVLPANREERMARFVTELDRRLREASLKLDELFQNLDAEKLALIEDGLRASARATQERRIEQIASIVADGVAFDDHAERQRGVLDLLNGLSNADVVHLARFANWRGVDSGPHTTMTVGQHAALSEEEKALFANERSSRAISEQKLIAAGLLRALLSVQANGHRDDEMVVVPGSTRLTELGEYFCRELNIWTSGDRHLFPTK